MAHIFCLKTEPIVAAGGVVYRRVGKQIEVVLIKKRGGFWSLPKGKVEPGETLPETVQREMREEIGIEGVVEQHVAEISYAIWRGYRRRRKQVSYYLLRALSEQLRPDPGEQIVKADWFPIKVAMRLLRRKRLRKVLRAAERVMTVTDNTL